MRTRSRKEILAPVDPEIEKTRRKIKSGQSKMRDNTREKIAFLRRQIQELLDDKAAEKAAKEEQERKNKELVPVMQMFNHDNLITTPEDPHIDANNFELRMP